MVVVGAVFRPQFPAAQLAEAARVAQACGVDQVWLWEDCFLHGGIASAAVILANSETVSVGIGVLPVPLRNVALTAMEIATLENTFPGRVLPGVGHGVQDWMGQVGARVASPLTLLREQLTCLRALLRGDAVTYAGRYVALDDVRLDWVPAREVPVFAAATGPKTLQLSGELASGTVLTGDTTVDGTRAALGHLRAGGATSAHEVAVYLRCSPGEAEQTAEAVRLYAAAGATTVALQPAEDDDIVEFLRFVGTAVTPLLREV